jgi:hypothetical protein
LDIVMKHAIVAIAVSLLLLLPAPLQAQDDEYPDYLSWSRPRTIPASYAIRAFPVRSFSADQPVVATYFFYWYDAATYRNAQATRTFDPYPFHSPNLDTITFHDPDWYEKEFHDMLAAGIDVVLPDYWGEPGQYPRRVAPAPELNYFATEGIQPMVAALDRLYERGIPLEHRPVSGHDDHERRGSQFRPRPGDFLPQHS